MKSTGLFHHNAWRYSDPAEALGMDWYQVMKSKDQKTLSELRWGRGSSWIYISCDHHGAGILTYIETPKKEPPKFVGE